VTPPGRDPDSREDWQRWRRTGGWPGRELPKEAPPWWPSGEPWPPQRGGPRWRRRGRPFMGGFGCLFGFVFFIVLIGMIAAVLSVIAAAGPVGDVARLLGLVVLILAAVAFAGAGHRIRSSASSLDELLVAAEKVEEGDYSVRVPVPVRAPRPVRDLVRGFNAMAGRLETSEAQRRTLLADVGHELRTPLAVVQGNVEAILDGVHEPDREHLESILEETRVLTRLVDDLRTITQSEAGRLAQALESHGAYCTSHRNVVLIFDGGEDAEAVGDAHHEHFRLVCLALKDSDISLDVAGCIFDVADVLQAGFQLDELKSGSVLVIDLMGGGDDDDDDSDDDDDAGLEALLAKGDGSGATMS